MELRCSCGAVLPSDARFCHKCGKPQYEEDLARLSDQSAATPVPEPVDVPNPKESKPVPIGFGNLRAVAITIAVAAITLVPLFLITVSFAMIAPPLIPLIIGAAGYCAAYFYRKQSAQPLTAGAGAYLGVMTGVWLFLVFALTAAMVVLALNSPEAVAMMRASLARIPGAANMLDDPHQFIVGIGQGLILWFFLTTVSAAFGGLLAARKLARRSQP